MKRCVMTTRPVFTVTANVIVCASDFVRGHAWASDLPEITLTCVLDTASMEHVKAFASVAAKSA